MHSLDIEMLTINVSMNILNLSPIALLWLLDYIHLLPGLNSHQVFDLKARLTCPRRRPAFRNEGVSRRKVVRSDDSLRTPATTALRNFCGF